MSLATLRDVLLWCLILNSAILALWSLLFLLPHGWLHRLWGRWSGLPAGQIDVLLFAGVMLYKILVIVFNLVPWLALWIVG